MEEDYFKKLDQKIDQKISDEEDKLKLKKEAEEKVRSIIKEITPLLNNYKSNLEERGIRVEFSEYPTGFSFLMYYSDGGHNGIALERDYQYDRYRFITKFTDDDGKSYTAEGGGPPVMNFSISEFERQLQRTIDDFIFLSSRHGGFKK